MAKILVTYSDSHPVDVELFTELLSDHDIRSLKIPVPGTEARYDEGIADALEGCDALFLRPGVITREMMESLPDLKVIAIHGSGYDRVDIEAATDHGIIVSNNPTSSGPGVVEHTFGLMFSLIRRMPEIFDRTASGEWVEARIHPLELNAMTIGVVGLGGIGFRVASIASESFDATVLGYDPYVSGERDSPIYPKYSRSEVEAAGIELTGLHDLLERSDLVTLHTPRTAETEQMIGTEELDRLAGKYLINTSRGGVIDEAALIDAVERDFFAGVALDVLAQEPPESDNPLLRSDSVLTTPHIAGISDAYLDRAARLAATCIQTALDGKLPETTVNPEVTER